MPALESDTQLTLPSLTVLKASAGSGKTFALTQRYVQFLLSPRIVKNDLKNILAITFSNNASREMRENVLSWLKLLAFGDPERLLAMTSVTTGGDVGITRSAGDMVEEILQRYSDFQVRTIDSFMSAVFRASALDFGYSPEFEIVMDAAPAAEYAFNLFLRDAREGSPRAALLDETVAALVGFKASDDSFPWDPATPLLEALGGIDSRLSTLDVAPLPDDERVALQTRQQAVLRALERTAECVASSGLEANQRSTFPSVLASARAGRFSDLIGRGMKTNPVRKPGAKDERAMGRYQDVEQAWQEVGLEVSAYVSCWARAFYGPTLRLHGELAATVEKVKRGQGVIYIGDVSRALAGYLDNDIVPDIYFRIGDRVWHFLIDEFQDTSPLQWRNLFPLVENSLAMGGSLFVVGDTKQAIYGFRQADYTIMRALETRNPFASAGHTLRELGTNWRSRPRVLALASAVFQATASHLEEYREAASRSGLSDWTQEPRPGSDEGYAEVRVLERDDEVPPEREALRQIMTELSARGYGWGDIALLATKNEHVVRATSWLNEMQIPFISFSSLDVRSRRIAGEILALLSFLDSPPDDLSFATFIMGDLFHRTLLHAGAAARGGEIRDFLFRCRNEKPLYKAFQRDFPALWKQYFAALFRSTGYMPLYDLVSEAYARFSAFERAPEEEATFAKLLETVKEFEGSGANSLREYLAEAAGDGDQWSISVPRSANSVRAMTVHKAKGLGFPVVIVLLYGESNHGFPYAVLRGADGMRLVKVTREIAAHDSELQSLYDEELVARKVDSLNGLYVALTRAQREIYVIGVKRERDGYPFDLLPSAGFQPSGEKGEAAPKPAAVERVAPLSHRTRTVPVTVGGGRLGREERRRGELVHRILQLAGAGQAVDEASLSAAAARAAREAREDPDKLEALAESLGNMIRGTALAEAFTAAPGRTFLIEQEFCDETGRLFRMDRVVVDPARVTVIDFKTGAEDPAAHEAQLRTYMHILSSVYPHHAVEALIAYVDHAAIRELR